MNTTVSKFAIEFFEVAYIIKNTITEELSNTLKKVLLKLNNPTFYSKHTQAHPAHNFGYYNNKIINPILIAITNMLSIIKSDDAMDIKTRKLQTEYSWAFNNYGWYESISKYTK
jgi:Trk K+ transport system NAD-binding subunit